MTRNKDLKKKIRARMAKTGERYSTARANVVGNATSRTKAPAFGGVHAETAAIRSFLHGAGVDDPRTKQPFSEAMVLGIGGGLGAAYAVFEYAGHAPHLYVASRTGHQYPYTADFLNNVCERLGVAISIQETGGKVGANKQLRTAVADGRPAIAWVDMASLPYWQLPHEQVGAMPHMVLVTDIDDERDRATIYDYSRRGFSIPMTDLNAARARLRKAKNRLASVDEGAAVADLAAAVRAGLKACVKSLDGEPPAKAMAKNWGLRGLAKWADLANDNKNKKGWPRQFDRGANLYAGLRQGYFWIEASGTGGGGFRPLYAQFLNEAAAVLKTPALANLGERYKELGAMWTNLAHTMLPDSVPLLSEARALLDAKRDSLHDLGPDAAAEISSANERLLEIEGEVANSFPLDEAATSQLYVDIATQVRAIYDAETAAAETLAQLAAGV